MTNSISLVAWRPTSPGLGLYTGPKILRQRDASLPNSATLSHPRPLGGRGEAGGDREARRHPSTRRDQTRETSRLSAEAIGRGKLEAVEGLDVNRGGRFHESAYRSAAEATSADRDPRENGDGGQAALATA